MSDSDDFSLLYTWIPVDDQYGNNESLRQIADSFQILQQRIIELEARVDELEMT